MADNHSVADQPARPTPRIQSSRQVITVFLVAATSYAT